MKTIISIIIGLCLTTNALAQCYPSNANFINGNLFPDPLNQWEFVDLHGNQSEDGFWFQAEKEMIYLFTILDEFGGSSAASDDYQITILDPQDNPVPGVYGRAFHDDVNYSEGETDPMLIWAPEASGAYKVFITRWYIGGCNEISPTDLVRVAYRGFMTSSSQVPVAVWTGVADDNMGNDHNWMYTSSSGQQLGYPQGISWQFIMDSNVPANGSSTSNQLICQELFLGTNQTIELGDYQMVEVTDKFFNPVSSNNGFFGPPSAGVIKGLDPLNPGVLRLRGQPNEVTLVGQFQDIELDLYSDITFKDGGFNLLFPNNFKAIHSYTSTVTLDDHVVMGVENNLWLHNNNAKLILKSHAKLLMADKAFFGDVLWPSSGGISFEGGKVVWECLSRAMRFTPVWAGNNQKAVIGFDLMGQFNTTVDINYFTYQPSQIIFPLNNPLVKVSSKEYFMVKPDQSGLTGRVTFHYHSGSGIGSAALNEIRLAGLTSQQRWGELTSSISNGYIDALGHYFNDSHQFTPASIGTSHPLRESGLSSDLLLSIYPNPAQNFVNLELGESGEASNVTVLDMLGKAVLQEEVHPSGRLDIRHLATGRYQIQLRQGSRMRMASFIKL